MPITRASLTERDRAVVKDAEVPNKDTASSEQSDADSGAARTRPSQPPKRQLEEEGDVTLAGARASRKCEAPAQPAAKKRGKKTGVETVTINVEINVTTNTATPFEKPMRILRNRIVGAKPSTVSNNNAASSGMNGRASPPTPAMPAVQKKAVRSAEIGQSALKAALLPLPSLVLKKVKVGKSASAKKMKPRVGKPAQGKGHATLKSKQPSAPQKLQQLQPTTSRNECLMRTRRYTCDFDTKNQSE